MNWSAAFIFLSASALGCAQTYRLDHALGNGNTTVSASVSGHPLISMDQDTFEFGSLESGGEGASVAIGIRNATGSAYCRMSQTVNRHAFAFSAIRSATVLAISTGSEEEGWWTGNASAASQIQYSASWTQLKTRRARIRVNMHNEPSGSATLRLQDNGLADHLDIGAHVGGNTGFRLSAHLETNVTLLASNSYAVNVSAGDSIDTGTLIYPIVGRSVGVAGYVAVEVLMMPTLTVIRRPGRTGIHASGDLLTWEASGEPFTLQSAASLGGPWLDVTNYVAQGSNYTLPIDTTAPAQFFRYLEDSGLTNFVAPASTNWFFAETLDLP